jgi:hypothetical protein
MSGDLRSIVDVDETIRASTFEERRKDLGKAELPSEWMRRLLDGLDQTPEPDTENFT